MRASLVPLSLLVVASLAGRTLAQNDECAGALPVVQGANGPFSSAAATTSTPWTCAHGGADLWFVYTATGTGPLTIDTCGSTLDTILELFDGNLGCGALTSIGCNDDACGLQSSVTVNVVPGDVVYARVGGYGWTTGSFVVNANGLNGTLATATVFGAGCPTRRGVAVYEQFGNGTFDLSNQGLLFQPVGDGSYTVSAGTNIWFAGFTNNLGLTDDSIALLTLPLPFPHLGGTATTVTASSNGFLWLDNNGDSGCCVGSSARFLSDPTPRIAPCWMDLNPSLGGGVYADLDPATGEFVVTWSQVPEFANSNVMNMQIALRPGGAFELRYGPGNSNTTHTALAGYTMGAVTVDPGNSDLSSAVTMPITTARVTAALQLSASGRPVLGTSIGLDTNKIAAGTALGVTVLGFSQFNPGFDLGFLGMPGCFQFASVDLPMVFVVAGSAGSVPLSFPNLSALNGLHVYAQSLTFTPGFNPFGALTSNGLDLGIGNQ